MHIHVGHNVPGYLPESDLVCFDDPGGALSMLRDEIKSQQDDYGEICGHFGTKEGCPWCDVVNDCEAAIAAIADGDTAYTLQHPDSHGLITHIFRPPEGPDMAHWAQLVTGNRESCEIAQEQEQFA
ncbi:hypothetical protein [Streptantibioticus ferralitis]|uniref:Uncharacterized protein n=1 Tax=Streptantibioticus ferralitis TaxID=236510 RepID=A0ABT5Z3G1_9ACTN|nr:hypothetical protein [Streptantibioticus ferralitis]MDF2258366.1 hypothetical protein [Streptantibioticus ferralitis]